MGGGVGVATGLFPGPEHRTDPELVLKVEVLAEVVLPGAIGPERIATPFTGQYRGAAEARRLGPGILK